jgi:hypothetical protein
MASFVVMERPGSSGGPRDFEAVRDGFHWLALIFPLFWFLFHRMWIEAAVVLLLGFGLGALMDWAGLDWLWPFSFAIALFAGFEAATLRVSALRRSGWREWGVVEGRDRERAELRYLEDGCAASGPFAADPLPAAAPAATARPGSGPALGLFSYPDGR